jgi:hypothetical protein
MAEELAFSIDFHEGSNAGMPAFGVDRFEDRAARHMISHIMEMMLAAISVICALYRPAGRSVHPSSR